MRVSERSRYFATQERIETAKNNNLSALNHLSTQKKINKLHDDPTGVARIVKHDDRLSEIKSYKNNVGFSKGFLSVTESAIANIQERLARARNLSMAMANDTYGLGSREATAREINEIINQIIQIANSRYNSKYVFSGFRTDTPAMDRDGAYLGDDGSIFLQLDRNRFKKINITGRHFLKALLKRKSLGIIT